jgi:hypothetical protein
MNFRLLNALFVTFLVLHASASLSGASTRWSKLAPKGEGFSIDVPGEPQPTEQEGHHVYTSGNWCFIIQSDSVGPMIRELFENGQHQKIATHLERVRDSMIDGANGTLQRSVSTDIDGYPSIQFSLDGEFENIKAQGINRIVLTDERVYMLVTIGPRGASPNADAERFLDSFRLVGIKPASARMHNRATPPKGVLTTKLAGPMLAVARLSMEQKLRPRIDEMIQSVPAAERLGSRWNPSNAAWQQARTAITRRIDRLADFYETSGEFERQLESYLAELGSTGDALETVLSGPAGSAILRSHALIQFTVTVMADDPNGPKPGERAWADQTTALKKVFDQRIGSAMPQDDGTHRAEVDQYLRTDSSRVFSNLWSSVLGKATVDLDGAINLLLFDNREVIMREIETAIAGAQ